MVSCFPGVIPGLRDRNFNKDQCNDASSALDNHNFLSHDYFLETFVMNFQEKYMSL